MITNLIVIVNYISEKTENTVQLNVKLFIYLNRIFTWDVIWLWVLRVLGHDAWATISENGLCANINISKIEL